jgi:hypothetical protein
VAKEANLSKRISYWLIPAEPERSSFRKIISKLAQRFDAPQFEPHVTLCSGPWSSVPLAVDDVITHSITGISNVELQSCGIGYAHEFTRTLFVKFHEGPTLTRLSNELKRRSPGCEEYVLDPHLSLLYAPVPEGVKARLAREIQIPTYVGFGAVCAIESGGRTETREDVERWKTIATQGLHLA